jgi:biotin carboxyl carrier protein
MTEDQAAAGDHLLRIDAACTSVNAYDLVVSEIFVAVGDSVTAEQVLMTLDYNKIITEIAAPAAGTITAIHCALGDEVQVGDRIIDLRPN